MAYGVWEGVVEIALSHGIGLPQTFGSTYSYVGQHRYMDLFVNIPRRFDPLGQQDYSH